MLRGQKEGGSFPLFGRLKLYKSAVNKFLTKAKEKKITTL